jgi:hypothetical protein
MVAELRGSTDDSHVRMTLGKFRKVFDPRWLQAFNSGQFTVQFNDDHDRDAVIRFAELQGYDLLYEKTNGWTEYHFG